MATFYFLLKKPKVFLQLSRVKLISKDTHIPVPHAGRMTSSAANVFLIQYASSILMRVSEYKRVGLIL